MIGVEILSITHDNVSYYNNHTLGTKLPKYAESCIDDYMSENENETISNDEIIKQNDIESMNNKDEGVVELVDTVNNISGMGNTMVDNNFADDVAMDIFITENTPNLIVPTSHSPLSSSSLAYTSLPSSPCTKATSTNGTTTTITTTATTTTTPTSSNGFNGSTFSATLITTDHPTTSPSSSSTSTSIPILHDDTTHTSLPSHNTTIQFKPHKDISNRDSTSVFPPSATTTPRGPDKIGFNHESAQVAAYY